MRLASQSPVILMILFLLVFPLTSEAREPSIQEIQQETIHYLGFDPQELEGWKKKARVSAALPRLQAGFRRELRDVVSLTTKDSVSVTGGDVFVGPSENNFDKNFNQRTSFDVRAVWSLNELIFNRDSIEVSRERRDWIRERNKVLTEVTEAYFARKRLLKELKERRDPRRIREQKKLLLDRANALMDAHTGGWFSGELAK